jgi:pectate lyase
MRTRLIKTTLLAATSLVTALLVPAVAAHAQSSAAPDGFAAVNALGQNGTTGGAGGAVVTATTTAQFLGYIARPEPLVVQVRGTITLPTTGTTATASPRP